MEKIGEVCSFFWWRATFRLLNRCFGVTELNFRDVPGYPRGFNQVDSQIGEIYTWLQ
jgi:hypothetical protein